MSGTTPVQASGEPGDPEAEAARDETGRTGGGESGGGAYKDQRRVKGDPHAEGFMGHGGQSDQAYRGTGDAADGGDTDNAVTQ